MKTTPPALIVALLLSVLVTTPALGMYHAGQGRFMQRDPVGYPDGANAYAAYHVMHGRLDPSGLFSQRFKDNWNARKQEKKGTFSIVMSDTLDKKDPRLSKPGSEATVYWHAPSEEDMECCEEVKFIQAETTEHDVWGRNESNGWQPDGRFWYAGQTPWTPGIIFNRAELRDAPGGHLGWTYSLSQTFVSIAVCSKGAEEGYVYGSFLWGHIFVDYGPEEAQKYYGIRYAGFSGGSWKAKVEGYLNDKSLSPKLSPLRTSGSGDMPKVRILGLFDGAVN